MPTELVNVSTGEVVPYEEPREFLGRSQEMAKLLIDVVDQQKLSVQIQGKKYLKLEAWQFLAAMANLTPRTRDLTEIVDEGRIVGVRVYVELVRDSDGFVIGGGFGRCDFNENIARSGKFAAESMATTRATNKAISQKLRYVAVLAGYVGTPAEEMTAVQEVRPLNPQPPIPKKKVENPVADAHEDPAMDAAFDAPPPVLKKVSEAASGMSDTPPSVGRATGGANPPAGGGAGPKWLDEPLKKITSRPNWVGRNWRWMCEGKKGGDRWSWCNGVLDHPDAPKPLKMRCEYVILAMEGKA